MIRILLEVILPILTPALIYFAYTRVERRRAGLPTGADPAKLLPWWATVPWLPLAGCGVLLAAAVLSVVVLRSGDPIHGVYIPAHLEHGQLVPGHVETQAEPANTK